jgi:gas vesicle protein
VQGEGRAPSGSPRAIARQDASYVCGMRRADTALRSAPKMHTPPRMSNDNLKDKIDNAADKAKDVADQAGTKVKQGANKVSEKTHDAADKIKDAGKDLGKKLGG